MRKFLSLALALVLLTSSVLASPIHMQVENTAEVNLETQNTQNSAELTALAPTNDRVYNKTILFEDFQSIPDNAIDVPVSTLDLTGYDTSFFSTAPVLKEHSDGAIVITPKKDASNGNIYLEVKLSEDVTPTKSSFRAQVAFSSPLDASTNTYTITAKAKAANSTMTTLYLGDDSGYLQQDANGISNTVWRQKNAAKKTSTTATALNNIRFWGIAGSYNGAAIDIKNYTFYIDDISIACTTATANAETPDFATVESTSKYGEMVFMEDFQSYSANTVIASNTALTWYDSDYFAAAPSIQQSTAATFTTVDKNNDGNISLQIKRTANSTSGAAVAFNITYGNAIPKKNGKYTLVIDTIANTKYINNLIMRDPPKTSYKDNTGVNTDTQKSCHITFEYSPAGNNATYAQIFGVYNQYNNPKTAEDLIEEGKITSESEYDASSTNAKTFTPDELMFYIDNITMFCIPERTVTFNTGSGTMDNNTVTVSDISLDISAYTPTAPTGMVFQGWSFAENGAIIATSIVDIPTNTDNTTLYAVYAEQNVPLHEDIQMRVDSATDVESIRGIRAIAKLSLNVKSMEDVEFGYIVTRKQTLTSKGLSAYALVFNGNLSDTEYVYGIAYKNEQGQNKVQRLFSEEAEYLYFTGVFTGIPSNMLDDELVFRPYIYNGTAYSYGAPIQASVMQISLSIYNSPDFDSNPEQLKLYIKNVIGVN